MLRETGNVGWTYECCHRITESFRSDMSYSLYAKSARFYVQEMRKLLSTHPWLHQKFVQLYHTVRRSERLWAGLWTHIVIEQVLMRSLKSPGGLTRGRGMTESVRQ